MKRPHLYTKPLFTQNHCGHVQLTTENRPWPTLSLKLCPNTVWKRDCWHCMSLFTEHCQNTVSGQSLTSRVFLYLLLCIFQYKFTLHTSALCYNSKLSLYSINLGYRLKKIDTEMSVRCSGMWNWLRKILKKKNKSKWIFFI